MTNNVLLRRLLHIEDCFLKVQYLANPAKFLRILFVCLRSKAQEIDTTVNIQPQIITMKNSLTINKTGTDKNEQGVSLLTEKTTRPIRPTNYCRIDV
jgi:hypothetical protein